MKYKEEHKEGKDSEQDTVMTKRSHLSIQEGAEEIIGKEGGGEEG